jgi:FtsH-binding integral membrane protein
MAGNINFNISRLPESPIFWILVAVLLFVGLLASGHPATAFTFLFVCVFIVCLVAAINSTDSNARAIYALVCIVCFLLVFALGWIFVPDEWNKKEEPAPQSTNTTKIVPEQLALKN